MKKLIVLLVILALAVPAGLVCGVQIPVKKGEAIEVMVPMVNGTDGSFQSGETVTDDCYYSDTPGSWSALAIANTVSEIGTSGLYGLIMDATEMNHNRISCKFTSTNALPNALDIRTYAQDIDDASLEASVQTAIANLAAAQADLDNPNQYKASGFSTFDHTSDQVTVGANSDKTGYSLTTADKDDIADRGWDELIANHQISGSSGAFMNTISVTLTGNLASGVLQNMYTVTDNSIRTITRGDANVTFTLNAGASWDLTGKKVYFIAKADRTALNSAAIVNRECTITDAPNGVASITLTAAETATVGTYYAEFEVRNADDTVFGTPRQFPLKISQDVRQ